MGRSNRYAILGISIVVIAGIFVFFSDPDNIRYDTQASSAMWMTVKRATHSISMMRMGMISAVSLTRDLWSSDTMRFQESCPMMEIYSSCPYSGTSM